MEIQFFLASCMAKMVVISIISVCLLLIGIVCNYFVFLRVENHSLSVS